MKLLLADFKEGVPTDVQHIYDPKKMDIEFVDLKYLRDLKLEGTVEKAPDTLIFRGQLATEIERTCGRCLTTAPSPFDELFEFFYEIEGKEEIDTTDDIREVLLLDHPLSFVCRESCKGLCPHCGINLNELQCDCEKKAGSKSFASLKEIWAKKGKEKKHGQS